MKFTIELKGITLPENVQEEISRDLNRLVMKKLGEIDLAQESPTAKGLPGYAGLLDLINGGLIYQINKDLRLDLVSALAKSFEIKPNLVKGGGFQNVRFK